MFEEKKSFLLSTSELIYLVAMILEISIINLTMILEISKFMLTMIWEISL